MINSMTGFANREANIPPFGKITVELRSSNHKFLETVFHLPVGLLSLEDRLKKQIEAKIKRGRVVCVINIIGGGAQRVYINQALLKNYLGVFKKIKERFAIKDEINIDTLINLPGVLSLEENKIIKGRIWSHLRQLMNYVLDDLVRMRQKEGQALFVHLKGRTQALKADLGIIKTRFKKVVREKLASINTDEERAAFLKETDITEEIERLAFHIRHFAQKLAKTGALGKELDFIAQEMQREANTAGAKSCDVLVSARVVQIKSQIEKIREQVQNIE